MTTLPVTSGLTANYDAQAIADTHTDGQAVSQWDDESGNANHATEVTSAENPTFWASDTTLNDHPVVHFDETKWLTSSFGTAIGQPTTQFAVWRIDNASTQAWTYCFDGINGTDRQWLAHNSGTVALGEGGTREVLYGKTKGFDYILTTSVFDPTDAEIWENGTLQDEGVTPGASMTGLTIGGRYSQPRLYGEIAELAYYDRRLTSQEQSDVEAHLTDKWFTAGTTPTTTTLSGTVTLDGTAQPNATVYVINQSADSLVATLTTDANGQFSYDASGTGPFHVTAQYDDGTTQYNSESLPYIQ